MEDPGTKDFLTSKLEEMIASAGSTKLASMKKYSSNPPNFTYSNSDKKTFFKKEVEVTSEMVHTDAIKGVYEQAESEMYEPSFLPVEADINPVDLQSADEQSEYAYAQVDSAVHKPLITLVEKTAPADKEEEQRMTHQLTSRKITVKAHKDFEFHIYPGKRVRKRRRVAVGGATGSAVGGTAGAVTGGVAGGVAAGAAGTLGGMLLGALVGTLVFPIVGTVIGGIGGAMVGGTLGATAGAAAGAAAGGTVGVGTGATIGGVAAAVDADTKKKKKAVVITIEDIFKCGEGFQEDGEYVLCAFVYDGSKTGLEAYKGK